MSSITALGLVLMLLMIAVGGRQGWSAFLWLLNFELPLLCHHPDRLSRPANDGNPNDRGDHLSDHDLHGRRRFTHHRDRLLGLSGRPGFGGLNLLGLALGDGPRVRPGRQRRLGGDVNGNWNFLFKGDHHHGDLIVNAGAIAEAAMAIAAGLTGIFRERPDLSDNRLMQSGMEIGKQIIGTTLNTLFFGFFGGLLALFIWFAGLDFFLWDDR